ncbi:MAG: hypothetical protein KJ970_18705 [Candidatus Eisenbacteria bacterium]|uniref:Uncharacterized protein n=1 Tax=Eiseniibacteriota bacterium TaxID=2212470 RepID=A0A948S0A5_UNCEI|nr:hypothetical protein [Candidatus Eisenbacteria bacterium]MBU1949326.1 hypothetical protein [Candidatus Eisenbacteria bacterium]MBU2692953.1 hypothetical protein [Candidatus Eisenbacteria bacterium]
MRRTLAVIVLCVWGAVSAGATSDSGITTQQPGLLKIPTQSTPWLLGSVSGLEKLQVSNSVSFGYSSGGFLEGPSGDYLTHLTYPVSSTLKMRMSLGVDWNPAFADAFGGNQTEFGIRDLQVTWNPSRHTQISFGYASYRGYQPWQFRPANDALGYYPGYRPWWGGDDVTQESDETSP